MKKMNTSDRIRQPRPYAGATLLEVLIAIVIFVIGMLALIHLQTNLGRSMGASNAQSVASSIAEETIENLRAFEQISTDPNGVKSAYNDITDDSFTVVRGGQNFTVTLDVDDWFYQADRVSLSQTPPAGQAVSDFKHLAVSVAWGGADFQTDFDPNDGVDQSSRLGSGTIVLSGIVPSIPVLGTAQVASLGNPDAFGITVDYTPGLNPDVVSLQIDTNKFKESTTPEPVVYRKDELVESWFDVITYNQTNSGAAFLRREEFLAVSCDCKLKAPTGGDDGARPILWTGTEYSEITHASKPYGESATNKQSFYCDVCCRDHHDGGSTASKDLTDPFRPAADYVSSGVFAGDHQHFKRNSGGALELADSANDDYVESCRLVRKDGFLRVAQDFRQEAMFGFPEDYLDEDNEINQYSGYVTEAVETYEATLADCQAESACTSYVGSPPGWLRPASATPSVDFPADSPDAPSEMPTAAGDIEQQLRSRGIYLDFLSDELRWVINCLQINGNTGDEINGNTGDDCGVPGVTSALEVMPFFDVQLTKLSRWNETPQNLPIDVDNEPVATDNTHSRGLAKKLQGLYGASEVSATSHKANLGLTATDPIDNNYFSALSSPNVYLIAIDDGGTPPPAGSTIVSGSLSSAVKGFNASGVMVSGTNANCGQTDATYSCQVVAGAVGALMTISGMTKSGSSYYACASNPLLTIVSAGSGTTVFSLPDTGTPISASITIEATSCP